MPKDSFRITASGGKIWNFDTKPACHRKCCGECGCHMYLHVDAFPDYELVHMPTLDRGIDVNGAPDRWLFTDSKHPMVVIPDDGLPRHLG